MLGASLCFTWQRMTRNNLRNARSIASAALAFYQDFTQQPAEFNSIFFKNC